MAQLNFSHRFNTHTHTHRLISNFIITDQIDDIITVNKIMVFQKDFKQINSP